MAPMRREVSLIIRKPQLVGCQRILQPPAAVQQERVGHRHRSNRSGLSAARREYPELLIPKGEAGAAGWLCWKSTSWDVTFVQQHSP